MRPSLPSPPAFDAAGPLSGRNVLVVGLGRWGGGMGVTRWLVEQGAHVTVTDQANELALRPSLDALCGLPVRFRLGGHDPADLNGCDLIVLNPAVNKRTSAFLREALARRVPYTTEINLFCARCPAPVVGVTGTVGKSTTCAMIAECLRACVAAGELPYRQVHLGGNIGGSLLNELASIGGSDIVVLELSNAQLEDLPQIAWAPAVAVITNLSPHHLDRYESPLDYYAAKINIARAPCGESRIVTGPLPPEAEAMLKDAVCDPGRVTIVSPPEPAVETSVPGMHNRINAATAWTVGRLLGGRDGTLRAALRAFRGLPHRLQLVRELNGVTWYNDSKATSPQAVLAAVAAFDRPLVALVGGQQKAELHFEACVPELLAKARAVICFGQAGPHLATQLRDHRPEAAVHTVETVADAVALAARSARPGDVVLFAPGAPSFDAYANFQERGQDFINHVQRL